MLDVVVTYDIGEEYGSGITRICKCPAHALLRYDGIFAEKDAVSMEQLSHRPLVLLDLPETRTYLMALFDFAARRPKLGLRTRSYETIRTAITNGLGVSVLNLKPNREASPDGPELPGRLLPLPVEERPDAAIAEFGRFLLLARAYAAAPDDKELRREIIAAESREDVLNDVTAPRVRAVWEVLGERVVTRRDGLVSVSTWLLNLHGQGPVFALLLDFSPASAGRRNGGFTPGEQFAAERAFYPARVPVRAVIITREAAAERLGWPAAEDEPLARHAENICAAPWTLEMPVALPEGRIREEEGGRYWWCGAGLALPLAETPPLATLGMGLRAAGLWNGVRLSLIAAQSEWGRISFDG